MFSPAWESMLRLQAAREIMVLCNPDLGTESCCLWLDARPEPEVLLNVHQMAVHLAWGLSHGGHRAWEVGFLLVLRFFSSSPRSSPFLFCLLHLLSLSPFSSLLFLLFLSSSPLSISFFSSFCLGLLLSSSLSSSLWLGIIQFLCFLWYSYCSRLRVFLLVLSVGLNYRKYIVHIGFCHSISFFISSVLIESFAGYITLSRHLWSPKAGVGTVGKYCRTWKLPRNSQKLTCVKKLYT